MTGSPAASYTPEEMMIVAAARSLSNGRTCLVGIGVPGAAACLASATHAPDLVLVYESGCIGSKPTRLPLTVGDGELADTALSTVSVPEIFAYWIQAGRIEIGLVSAAQIDRYANLNSTVIGTYDHPTVRLPGAGGAPEIVGSCARILVMIRHDRRRFVEKLDFVTSVGFGAGVGDRRRLGLTGGGPAIVFTNLGILQPDSMTCELTLTGLHPGVTIDEATAATGWPLKVAESLSATDPPTDHELSVLRQLLKP